MVEAQMEVKSDAFSNCVLKKKSTQCHIYLSKDIKFGQNVSYAVGEEYNISYFTEIIYFWFYWLLDNDEWPLPTKSELLCSMDKHNFLPQIVPKCWYFNDDSISTMEW